MKNCSIGNLREDTRVFNVDKSIQAKFVTFRNRYGIDVAGHLYLPKNFNSDKKYAAITGKSGEIARDVASLDIFTEDYSAAIDFVGNLAYVDREKLGVMGICGLSGMAVSAMYDMVDSIRNYYAGDYYTPEQREIVKNYLADMRWKESKLFPEKLPANVDSVTKEFFAYYRGRAFHPRPINSNAIWSSTTPYGFFNFRLDSNVEELSPRPILLITGDKAHSKYHSYNLFAQAKSPKEIIVVKGATHTDLYDNVNLIPFNRLNKFFKDNLK